MNTLPFVSFGEMLKAFRKRQHLTQKVLAARIGVHPNTISIWERGSYLPDSKTIVLEVASQLGLDEQETRQLLEASLTAISTHWFLPFPRNPFFTGRVEALQQVHALLQFRQAVVLSQSYALHGLGGIGKTQMAVEYAYQHALEYTAIFWIGAESAETIVSSFFDIAMVLQLPEQEVADQRKITSAVQSWLATHKGWLLIWDNLEDFELLQSFSPSAYHGAHLITTRSQAVGTLAQGIELSPMTSEEGIQLLLRRSKVLATQAEGVQVEQLARQAPTDYAIAHTLVTVMGGLPLALDQAGAYIEETGCSISDYLQRYTLQRAQLLDRRGMLRGSHPESVTATFRLICQRLKQEHPSAVALLSLCTFFHAEAIPEELFTRRISHRVDGFNPLTADPSQLDFAIASLRAFSLIQRHSETRTLSIHRLVQAVLLEEMSDSQRRQWQQQSIHLLNAFFPEAVPEMWQQCERYLSHVLACAASIPEQAVERELAEVLRKTADYLRERAQYGQAEALYQRAQHIWEQTVEPDYAQTASLFNGMAQLSYRQGKYEQAERHFQQAWRIREQILGPEHPQVALVINNLAVLYAEQGKYEQAERHFQQAQRISEQILGPEHPQIAISLGNRAILSSIQGNYEQAEAFHLRALSIREKGLGLQHPETARSLVGLANLYADQKRYEQAEELYQRVRHIWEQVLGPEHPEMATVLNNLADLHVERGQYEQAEPLLQQAQHIWEQALGPEHPLVASAQNGLASLYQQQGNYEQAEALYRRALDIREKYLGPQHPETARSLVGLALLYEKRGSAAHAEQLFLRACAIFEQSLGQAHPEAVKTRNDYQSFLAHRRHAAEASVEAQQTAIHPNVLPPNRSSEETETFSSEQSSDPQTLSKDSSRSPLPNLHVAVKGSSEHVAYTRKVRVREVTITCVVCGKTVTQMHYPSGRIKYCSESCRDSKRAQMHEERVRKQREKRRALREIHKQAQHQGM